MTTELAVKGVLIGLILALPTGPVGILCLRRTLAAGQRAGLVSGVGVCFADLFYVIVVRLGLTRIEHVVSAERLPLHLLAGLIVIAAGSRIIASPPDKPGGQLIKPGGLLVSAFLMSVTNPTMLVSIPAVFAVTRFPTGPPGLLTALMTVVSVFAGSMIWWSAITRWLDRSSASFSDQTVRRASTLAGVALITLGVVSISSLMV
jgi:threonine/homoserine/homoserine lactone efflux protein